MKKIVIFSILLIISVSLVLFKENVNIKDDVYVVSNSESKEKESTLVKNDSETEIINNRDGSTNEKEITVYISGEVVKPGIVSINKDKRLYDAVQELGGVTEGADLNKINLAIKLDDEQHYIIPKIGENNEVENENKVEVLDEVKSDENKKINININTADIQELDNLPGVGEATANKIVKYREENNKFNSIEEIKNVNGIGDKKYGDIKDLICVE